MRKEKKISATARFPDGASSRVALRSCWPIPFAISGAIRQSRLRRHRTHAPATPLIRCHTSFTDGVRRVMPLKRFLFTSPPLPTTRPFFLLILLDQQREKRLTNGAFGIYGGASARALFIPFINYYRRESLRALSASKRARQIERE